MATQSRSGRMGGATEADSSSFGPSFSAFLPSDLVRASLDAFLKARHVYHHTVGRPPVIRNRIDVPDLNLVHTQIVCHYMKERIEGKLGKDDLLASDRATGSTV